MSCTVSRLSASLSLIPAVPSITRVQEVNRSRALRASRAATRSQKSISSLSGVASPTSPMKSPPLASVSPVAGGNSIDSSASTPRFQPGQTVKHTASSFPVFAGRTASGGEASSNGASLSLANFIGGDTRVKGPVLNRVRPYEEEAFLTPEERTKPQATFLTKNPALLPQRAKSPAVALPGMTRPGQRYSGSGSSQSGLMIRDASSEAEKPEISTTNTSTVAYGSKSPLFSPSHGDSSSIIAVDRNLSKSPVPMEKLSLSDNASPPIHKSSSVSDTQGTATASSALPIHTFGTPSLPGKLDLDETSSPSSDSTPSLTRLKGSNLVKQRLQWGEAQKSSAGPSGFGSAVSSARSSRVNSPKGLSTGTLPASGEQSKPISDDVPTKAAIIAEGNKASSSLSGTPLHTKRSSVLDRRNRDTPDARGASQPGSSPVSPKPEQSKWPKPTYAKPTLASKQSWSSMKGGSESRASTATASSGDASKAHHVGTTSVLSNDSEKPAEASVTSTVADSALTEEPKALQRPSTKPPWMAKEEKPAAAKGVEPLRTTSFPKPELPTAMTAARSAVSVPQPSKSLPPHSLPISVSPVPYARSPAPPGPTRSGPTSPRTGVFQPSGVSFPVSLGMAPTHSRPLSVSSVLVFLYF